MLKRSLSVILLAAFLAGSWTLLSGCSAFESSREMDMTPFAANTAAMFAEASKINRSFPWFYLKPFTSLPELIELQRLAVPTLRGLGGIVMYSNQVVALNMSSKSEKEKNKELAKYLQEVTGKVTDKSKLAAIGIEPASLDTVFLNIQAAETFLGGLSEASPLVNAFVLAMLSRLDEIGNSVPGIETAISREIEKLYADKRRNYQSLVTLQTRLMREVALLYAGRYGDRASLDTLVEGDPAMKEFVRSTATATPRELESVEKVLQERLERVDTIIRQLDGEKKVYLEMNQELLQWRLSVDEKVKIARDAVMVWGQSHRNLAAGIAVPPLIDVGGMAGGLAKKVVPLP